VLHEKIPQPIYCLLLAWHPTGGVPKADEPLSFSFEANSLLWRRLKGGPQQQRQAKAHGSGSSSSESQNHDDQQDRPALATLSEAEVTAAGFNWRGYLLRNGDLRKQVD
jgi:hypothetical protein